MRLLSWRAVLSAIALFFLLSCSWENHPKQAPRKESPIYDIATVIKIHADSLLAIPGVVGIYEGLTDAEARCIKVMVKNKSLEILTRVPKSLEGYPVEIEVTGPIEPMNK
jgi:hypothetical protein